MATTNDYYNILGVQKNSSEEEIKTAYRKLALKLHPDKNPGDKIAEEKFREVTEAYEILKDPQKRSQYDQFGKSTFQQGRGPGGFSNGFGFAGFDISDALRAFMQDFEGETEYDIGESPFGNIFGRRSRRTKNHSVKGSDLQIKLPLSLEEISTGIQKVLKIKRKDRCSVCSGSGSKDGHKQKCTSCNGQGRVRKVSQSIFGQTIQDYGCPTCGGTGSSISNPCSKCNGEGIESVESTVKVSIPAGISEGNYITIPDQGNAGANGGDIGDLIVIINEKQHPIFQRHGADLLSKLDITFSQAALGASQEIETIYGKVSLKIPAGTQSEKVLKLKGKGLPLLQQKDYGDQLVQVHVKTPEKLSHSARELLEKLAEEGL
jgi:molecular chaperone DnaJ